MNLQGRWSFGCEKTERRMTQKQGYGEREKVTQNKERFRLVEKQREEMTKSTKKKEEESNVKAVVKLHVAACGKR